MDDSNPIIDVTPHPAGFVPADDVWAFLRRRKGLIAIFWLIFLVAGVWWLLSRPHAYQAESRVMILRTGSGGPISDAELASEIELIRDPDHIEKTAIKELPTSSNAMLADLIAKIDAGLQVGPAGKSNLLAIQFRDPDPANSARVVNQIVEFYLAERRFIFQPTSQQHSAQPPAAAATAVSAADLLSAFDALNHGTELRAELDSRVQRRIDLEGKIAELKAQIRDNQETSVGLRKRLTTLPDRIHSRTRTRTGPSPNNPQVEDTEILNPIKQQMESDILTADSHLAGLRARLDETQKVFREARAAEDRTSALTAERDKLARRAQEAQQRLEPASRDSNANDRPNLRASLVNRAEAPTTPLPRRNWIWIPVTLIVALILALIIAWLIDQFDKPIYTSDDFEEASGVPPPDQFARGAGA
jgi:capsular polysaccharide biosynthesis protein